MMKKELGKWILDVTKYVTTVGLIAPFLAKVESIWWYISLFVLVLIFVILGLYLTKEDVKVKSKKK